MAACQIWRRLFLTRWQQLLGKASLVSQSLPPLIPSHKGVGLVAEVVWLARPSHLNAGCLGLGRDTSHSLPLALRWDGLASQTMVEETGS